MKLLVLNYEYPPIGGGAGSIAKYIAEGLVSHGNEVHVITTFFGNMEHVCIENGVKVTRLTSKRKYRWKSNPLEMLSWMRAAKSFLREELKNQTYDLCFAHFAIPGGEVAYSMYLDFNLPYVIMSHGHDIPWFFPKQMWLYHSLTYHWIRKLVMNSNALFVQSEDMEKNAKLFLPDYKHKSIIQIPNGWDASFYFPLEMKERNPQLEIVFPGRLVKQKDPFTLLQAIRLVVDKIPAIHVRILGDGPLRKRMEKWVLQHNLSDTINFEGWLDKKSVREAYQKADIVVLPSLNEGMSMASLEAMACGTYLMVTDVSRNSMLIQDGVNGNLIKMSDSNDLSEKIIHYYKTKYLQEYSVPDSSRKMLSEMYSWDKIVSEYNELLHEFTAYES
jgi:glycosyltransferase involved in cell wall biosynthesis